MLSFYQRVVKRGIDVLISVIAIAFALIPMLILVIIASYSTHSFGLFFQDRIGKNAKPFTMFKIKTMRKYANGDLVITRFGKVLRRSKLDELPQLFNVIIGTMSLVGPRPDVKGYADELQGDDRIILTVKPGITGPATLHFSNEETILSEQSNPQHYNDSILWPQKVAINKEYVQNWSLTKDFGYLLKTVKLLLR